MEPSADQLQRTWSVSKFLSLEFKALSGGPKAKHSRASGFWFLPSTTIVSALVWTNFPTGRKKTLVFISIEPQMINWSPSWIWWRHVKRSVLKWTLVQQLWIVWCNRQSAYLPSLSGDQYVFFLHFSQLDFFKDARNRCVGKLSLPAIKESNNSRINFIL